MVRTDDDDFPDDSNANQPRVIVKDTRAQLRLERERTKEARARYAAIVAKEKAEKSAERQMRREEIQLELARIKLSQSASEKARTNIALTTPLLLVVLLGGFLGLLATGTIPDDQVSVASALLTLVATALMQNLRSIVSEGAAEDSNGNGNGNGKPKSRAKPKPPTDPEPSDPKPPKSGGGRASSK
tara:strand:+ start:4671 stop:5228 length:558 start_codon:yes stop_codon:yes gene_type:complete